MNEDLLSYLLPEGLLDFFEITQLEKSSVIIIHSRFPYSKESLFSKSKTEKMVE